MTVPSGEDAELDVLSRRGFAHEDAHLDGLRGRGADVAEISDDDDLGTRVAQTLRALHEGREISGPHWSGEGGAARYADVTWEVIVPLADRLPIDELLQMVADVPWHNLQGSGVQVASTASARLFRIWETHLESIGRR